MMAILSCRVMFSSGERCVFYAVGLSFLRVLMLGCFEESVRYFGESLWFLSWIGICLETWVIMLRWFYCSGLVSIVNIIRES